MTFDLSRVHWLCDVRLTKYREHTGQPSVEEACRELGVPVTVIDYDQGRDRGRGWRWDVPPHYRAPLVSYGTIQFIHEVRRSLSDRVPGSYSKFEKLGYGATAGNLGDLMLNRDFIILPYGEVLRRGCDALGDAFFLKPEGVQKAFTGFVMTREKWDTEVKTLSQKSVVDPDLLCVVAKPQEIEAEFRFVIADRRVVTGSQYRWDDRLDVRLDVLPICLEMAERVARHPWQPDRVYVCDVALLEDRSKARVVELNTFSSSGLYACDTREIVKAVSLSAWREWRGDDEVEA